MPIPTPHSGEGEQEFISRCMGAISGEFDSQEQRAAVCYGSWRDRNTSNEHRSAVVNRGIFYTTRTEQYEGREHIVAPVVILTEGVHHGSNGPLYYPLEELATIPMAWNGVPVVVRHPEEGSANDPAILDRQCVGRLFNVNLDGSKLKGEIWIDRIKCQSNFPEVMHYFNTNTPLEVSTGLFTEDDPVSGTWNNEQYVAVARRYRPDHLALLPGGTGACSWADGCGVRANQETREEDMAKYQAVINVIGAGEDLRERVSKVREAVDRLDSPVAVNYCLAVYEDSVIYEVVPNSQATPGMARKCYKRGYTVENGEVVLDNNLTEVVEQRTFTPVSNEERPNGDGKGCGCGDPNPKKLNTNKEGEDVMAKNTPERKAKVDALLAANAGFAETDREMLEGLECNQFAAIEQLAARPVSAPAPVVIDNETALLAAVTPELKSKVELGIAAHNEARTQAITTIKSNTANPFTDDALQAKSLDELKALAQLAAASAPATGATSFAANAGEAPPAAQVGTETPKVEPLPVPKMNWDNK